MALARFRSGLCRDLIAALLLALAMLSGVVQARAATETAANKGFAGAFELCLQSAASGGHQTPHDHDCDECRIPGLNAALAVSAPHLLVRDAFRQAPARLGVAAVEAPDLYLPDARGPPEA